MTQSFSLACRERLAALRALAIVVAVLVLAAFIAPPVWAVPNEAPDALVKRITEEVLNLIRSDPRIQAGDKARIREVIEARIAPYFDFERMTALAAGRGWRQATPEQKKELAEQFKTLLVRTYSGALNQYRDQTIEYKPLRGEPSAGDVVVRTDVVRPGQAPVQIDYSMEKTAADWKAYDVIVGGVSLVTNYRDEFTAEIQRGGIDGLIKALVTKNSETSAK